MWSDESSRRDTLATLPERWIFLCSAERDAGPPFYRRVLAGMVGSPRSVELARPWVALDEIETLESGPA